MYRERLTNISVANLLLGRCGKVYGEYQIANTVRERQTVNGDNYFIFNICDLNPINVRSEPSICMKIWQSDKLDEELYEGLQEDNVKIRLTGVTCAPYQDTPQLTLKGDFSDGRINLIDSPSVPLPNRAMVLSQLSLPSQRNVGNRRAMLISQLSAPNHGNAGNRRAMVLSQLSLPNHRTSGHNNRRSRSLSPNQAPNKPNGKRCLGDTMSASRNAEAKRVKRVVSDDDRKEPEIWIPHEIKNGNSLTKIIIFQQGKEMGLTLESERLVQVPPNGDQVGAVGIGAKVTNFERDRSIVGMVIYEVNGDTSFRNKPLTEIQSLLSALLKLFALVVIFGPPSSPGDESTASLSPAQSSSETLLNSKGVPSEESSNSHIQQVSSTLGPISPVIPKPVGCELCIGLNQKVESYKKRVELLEGKTSVRKLSVDQLEDLLENAESLMARVRRELAKRGKKPQPECSVCLDAKPNQTFVPCGHCVCCEECASKLEDCPVCRKKITQKVKNFFS